MVEIDGIDGAGGSKVSNVIEVECDSLLMKIQRAVTVFQPPND